MKKEKKREWATTWYIGREGGGNDEEGVEVVAA